MYDVATSCHLHAMPLLHVCLLLSGFDTLGAGSLLVQHPSPLSSGPPAAVVVQDSREVLYCVLFCAELCCAVVC